MIGIIPAAGKAERMGGLPKFLLPIPGGTLLLHLTNVMSVAWLVIGANSDNFDLVATNADYGIAVITVDSRTMAETIIACKDHFRGDDESCYFGMPDTYFEDNMAFDKLEKALDDGADVAVGLFETRPDQRPKLGMCRLDGAFVTEVVDKPASTDLTWAWGVLAWKPAFWQFIRPEDATVGYALQRAIDAELDVRAVPMDGAYFDCGTPDEYFALIRHLTTEAQHAV